MSHKTLKTRIQSKFDYLSVWNEHGDFKPLKGEIIIGYVPSMPIESIPEGSPEQWTPSEFLMKVGNGEDVISDLQWITAKAGDVWSWAKKQYLDWNDLDSTFLSCLSVEVQSYPQKDFLVKDATVRIVSAYNENTSYSKNILLKNENIVDQSIYRVISDISESDNVDWNSISANILSTNINNDISVGQHILDFEINVLSGQIGQDDEKHIYIPVKDLFEGMEFDSFVSANVESTDISSDHFNVVDGLGIWQNNGRLNDLSVHNKSLSKIALEGNVKYLTQDEDDYLILDCGSAIEVVPIVSANYTTFYYADGTKESFLIKNEINRNKLDELGIPLLNLLSVEIGTRVTSIADFSFYSCMNLASVKISNSVTSIGELTFFGCDHLSVMTIPNSVTSIGRSAFANCRALIMSIPSSVTSIGQYAFMEVPHVEFLGRTIEEVESMANYNWSAKIVTAEYSNNASGSVSLNQNSGRDAENENVVISMNTNGIEEVNTVYIEIFDKS